MIARLRELAERWHRYANKMYRAEPRNRVRECADELLSILDAEGDGGADEFASVAVRSACPACGSNGPCEDPAKCGATKITHPARSGGVSDAFDRLREVAYRDEAKSVTVRANDLRAALTHFAKGAGVGGDAEDAARYRWLRRNHNADLLAEDVIDEAIQGERHE